MVSSDFGKLEVMRHLISGEDCAIAGEATAAAAAAPVADTFKKSRRFISGISLLGNVSLRHSSRSCGNAIFACREFSLLPGAQTGGALTRMSRSPKRELGMIRGIIRPFVTHPAGILRPLESTGTSQNTHFQRASLI